MALEYIGETGSPSGSTLTITSIPDTFLNNKDAEIRRLPVNNGPDTTGAATHSQVAPRVR